MDPQNQVRCPYCHEMLKRWVSPELTSWGGEFQLVCFNDACPYYVRGWIWMESQFKVSASYRYRLDPVTGEAGPLAVWSNGALKNRIVTSDDLYD